MIPHLTYEVHNRGAPWVLHYRGLWLAYPSLMKAIKSIPTVWRIGRNIRTAAGKIK